MWAEAATWLARFPDAVLTAVDPAGYPVSVRQTAPRYDPATGKFPLVWPPDLPVAEGPATVLCHHHDEKLWNLKQIQIKGRRATGRSVGLHHHRIPPAAAIAISHLVAARPRHAGSRKALSR